MDFITNPDSFMEKMKDRSFLIPLIIVIISAIVGTISAFFAAEPTAKIVRDVLYQQGFSEERAAAFSTVTYYLTLISPAVFVFIIWFVVTVILYLLSAVFGGSGDFRTLLKLIPFSFIPTIILSPLTVYISYQTSRMMGAYGIEWIKAGSSLMMASSLVGIAVLFWQYVYWVFAVKNARNLSLRNSAITAALPLIALIVITVYSLTRSISTP